MAISPSTINISFDKYVLSDYFNIIDISEPPSLSNFEHKLETIANGAIREVLAVVSDREISFTVDRENATEENLSKLAKAFSSFMVGVLKISSKIDGKILYQYNKATVKEFKPLGAIADGQANNFMITLSVADGKI